MALVKACNVSTSIKNTGVGCSSALGPLAMILAMPTGLKFSQADIDGDFTAKVFEKMHGDPGARVFGLFGNNAPVWDIESNDSDDVYEEGPNGGRVFIRSGYANRTISTTKGGLCLAESMRSFIGSGYGFMEIDNQGQIAMKKNSDGTYSAFPAQEMGGTTPRAATFATVYKNVFTYSYDPNSYINGGVIFKGAEGILGLNSLLEVELKQGSGTTTATQLFIDVNAECTGDDLVALLNTDLADVDLWKASNNTTGAPITVSAAAIVSGEVQLTITSQTTGTKVKVTTTLPSVWFTNGVEGYDGSTSTVLITIP